MRFAKWLLLTVSVLSLWPPDSAFAQEKADTVFVNGAVYTMDAKKPRAEAVAVHGRKIVYAGSNSGAKAFVGRGTKVIDLGERMLLPGFIDAHVHPTAAHVATGADLQFDTPSEILAAAKKWADAHTDNAVVIGFGWRYVAFPSKGPTKAELDRVFPDRPAFLVAIDGHSAWVNSKALQMAGIDSTTPDPLPPTSYFQRDEKGEPTGWLVEVPAMQVALVKLKPPSPGLVAGALEEQVGRLAAAGITSVFDAGILGIPQDAGFGFYRALEKGGNLPVRVVGSYYWNDPTVKDPVAVVSALGKQFHSALVQPKVLKINVDGGDLQHTAVMLQSYADRPGFHGDFVLEPKVFDDAIMKAQAAGVDTHAHVFGDGAVAAYLDAIERARKAHPRSPSRHTAAHALYLTDEIIARMVRLDVTAQFTPHWMTPEPSNELTADTTIGRKVMFAEYGRIGSVLKQGGRVAMGSDWPASGYVSTFRPLDEIQAAITRSILARYGTKRFADVMPPDGERITLDQALRAQTLAAAYVLHMEKQIGSIEAGKLADLVVVEKDLHGMPPAEISGARVQLTMMNGRITHRDGI
jgi:predicted amidohydrolase YtcJ